MQMTNPNKNTGSYEQRRRARRRVAQALYQWQMTAHSAAEIAEQFGQEQSWDNVDREYFELLLVESIRENEAITECLTACLDRPIAQVDCLERAVLQLATAELMYHPEIPFKVVLDEAIDLAKRFGADQSHSYVNAVLDKAAKQTRSLEIGGKSKSKSKSKSKANG